MTQNLGVEVAVEPTLTLGLGLTRTHNLRFRLLDRQPS